ncbi:MAG TPA: hypothetical protein VK762_22305 [Polyangiaceae bacterium]|nr:hypothetical protein [Polyangiaceae bacterium]
MNQSPPSPEEHALPSVVDDDGDRVSVTDVNGTIARFEMTYSPPATGRLKFGPPLASRIPSAIYLAGALVLGALVLYAYTAASSNSLLFVWVVEKDRGRPLSANVLTAIVVVSALGTVLRTHMRGVLVSDDWVEARYLLAFGIPRSRRWAWTQVLRVVLDGTRVAFELWDGSFERLPQVAKGRELVDVVLQHAQRRRIDVTVLDAATRQ